MKEAIAVAVGFLLFFAMLFSYAEQENARTHELRMTALESGCVVVR
jgi:hypothetical protein